MTYVRKIWSNYILANIFPVVSACSLSSVAIKIKQIKEIYAAEEIFKLLRKY